jgi:DeoR family fructose operon transcriptional repressor
MLAQERQDYIAQLVRERGTVSASFLVHELKSSVSTIRRDIDELDREGRVSKVYGGATAPGSLSYETTERTNDEKYSLNVEAKDAIGRYAASLVEPGDFVYIDTGSTTECLVNHLEQVDATYVTNSTTTAQKLVRKGFRTLMLGGELKGSTDALFGPGAIASLELYHFTKGFWGCNGVTRAQGFTTPDINEAQVKRLAMERTGMRYVLCDADKIGRVAPITFAKFSFAVLVTYELSNEQYKKFSNVVEVSA